MKNILKYNDTNMRSTRVGEHGSKKEDLAKLQPKLEKATKEIERLRMTNEQGFFQAPFDEEVVRGLEKLGKKAKSEFDHLLVIGTGGSSLGGMTLIQSLADFDALSSGKKKGLTVSFLSNPDPEILAPWLDKRFDWTHTAINVISKSGSTMEVIALFLTIKKALIQSVGKEVHHKHIFVTTETQENPLSRLALENNYTLIEHKANIGGRFSVLSAVGLFPAIFAGIDVKGLLKGAQEVEETHRKKGAQHPVALFAAHHYLAYKNKKTIHVLMPYAQRLSNFGKWYLQLWAESLGKHSRQSSVGPTPVAVLGTVDQHSQIQLYNDGPNNKVVTFLEVESFRKKARVPNEAKQHEDLAYLAGVSFSDMMHSSYFGTAKALTKHQRPNGTIYIKNISPESLGALFQFYELATVYLGLLFNINPFDQPGVEEGKIQIRKRLQKRLSLD